MSVTKINTDQIDPVVAIQAAFGSNWGELDETGDPAFASLIVSGNTTLGDASGDTLTINAAAWSLPNTVTWTRAAASSTAESIVEWKVSDSPSLVRVINGTSNANEFAPMFEAAIEAGKASTALTFLGTKGVATTPGNPAVLFLSRYNSGSGNTDIPDAGIMVEWRNRATSCIYVYGDGAFKVVNPKGSIGYGTGAGGTATQATDKSTTVAINRASGQITMNAASLNGDTTVSFTLTNSVIASTDVLILNHVSGGTIGAYTLNASCGSGAATIYVRNITGGALGEAIVIRFALIKGATT